MVERVRASKTREILYVSVALAGCATAGTARPSPSSRESASPGREGVQRMGKSPFQAANQSAPPRIGGAKEAGPRAGSGLGKKEFLLIGHHELRPVRRGSVVARVVAEIVIARV